MVQNILLKKDPANPGVRGIAARFEALASASPPQPPSPISNKPKISFRNLSFSPSPHQKNQLVPGKLPPKDVSLPTKANGSKLQLPDDHVTGATEPVSSAEFHRQRDEKVHSQDASSPIEIINDLVEKIALEEQDSQVNQSNTVEDIDAAAEEETVQQEPSPSVVAEDVDASNDDQEEPITVESTVDDVVSTSQKVTSKEQKSFVANEAHQASEIVLEE